MDRIRRSSLTNLRLFKKNKNRNSDPILNTNQTLTPDDQEEQIKVLGDHVEQIKISLTYFKSVLIKKLESGSIISENGSIILELFWKLNIVLQKLKTKETNHSMESATSEMQMMLSKLIKLCDQQSLYGTATPYSGWTEENVCAIVDSTFSAIENLLKVSRKQFTKGNCFEDPNISEIAVNTKLSSAENGILKNTRRSDRTDRYTNPNSLRKLIRSISMQEPRSHYSIIANKNISTSSSIENSTESFDLGCNWADVNSEIFSEEEEEKEKYFQKINSFSSNDETDKKSNEPEQASVRALDNSYRQKSPETSITLNCDEGVSGLKSSVKVLETMNAENCVNIRNKLRKPSNILTYIELLTGSKSDRRATTHGDCLSFSSDNKVSFDSVFSDRSNVSSIELTGKVVPEQPNCSIIAGQCGSMSKEGNSSGNDIHCKEKELLSETAPNILAEISVSKYLIETKTSEPGRVVKGGPVDALIVYASKPLRCSDATDFGEAFLTTFRTFIEPSKLIEKLIYRYETMTNQADHFHRQSANESFFLILRVVNDLTAQDVTHQLLEDIMSFSHALIVAGHLQWAKLLRDQILEKVVVYKSKHLHTDPIPSRAVTMKKASFLQLPSQEMARQMTLLDMELFQNIDVSEMLYYAKAQNDECSPNLNRFTEHFNKMSYWAQSQILGHTDKKKREKYVLKFINIMKYLKEFNNFNSFLALLAALQSTDITRLTWSRKITDSLEEYAKLFDSRKSFDNYRKALAAAQPPCIPYIGMILSDLTFVHLGNDDLLPDNSINFEKRWLQYDNVLNMKRFRYQNYHFERNERILLFFDNFDDYLHRDALWEISRGLKAKYEVQ